jgi:hypothetical protein|tara:strand:- start:362 stop:970 length:609 start_codon:yes stop_codon:yes gene_type:complete
MQAQMKITNIKVNYSAIRKKLMESPAMKSKVLSIARRKAEQFFIPRKREFMSHYDSHPVSMEVQGGRRANNTSGVLGGYGNLFTFIGFEDGSNPVEELRQHLDASIKLRYIDYKKLSWRFRVIIPTKAGIISASEIPWQRGASWALEIEKGISGLGHYLRKDSNNSRSGGGIQVKNPVRAIVVSRAPYLGDMLDTFRRRLRR